MAIVELHIEDIEPTLYKMKCKKCKKKYKSEISHNKVYKCPHCDYETSELLLTKKSSNQFKNDLKSMWQNIYNSIDSIIKNLPSRVNKECEILGKYGWAFYCIDDVDPEINYDFLINVDNGTEKDYTKEDIDEYIVKKIFNKEKKELIIENIKKYLSESDIKKLNDAIYLFNGKRYYSASGLILELIDSTTINFNINDSKNPSKTLSNTNIGAQGWDAINVMAMNNLKNYIVSNSTNIKPDLFKNNRNTTVPEYLDNVEYKKDNLVCLQITNLLYVFLKVFTNSDWTKTSDKPTLNRHWKMHGMYLYEDITKIDCIKLFILLYQELLVYDAIK